MAVLLEPNFPGKKGGFAIAQRPKASFLLAKGVIWVVQNRSILGVIWFHVWFWRGSIHIYISMHTLQSLRETMFES